MPRRNRTLPVLQKSHLATADGDHGGPPNAEDPSLRRTAGLTGPQPPSANVRASIEFRAQCLDEGGRLIEGRMTGSREARGQRIPSHPPPATLFSPPFSRPYSAVSATADTTPHAGPAQARLTVPVWTDVGSAASVTVAPCCGAGSPRWLRTRLPP